MRLFFAIPLPEPLKEHLAHFQAHARTPGVAASWPDPRGLHITVAFLGDLDEAMVPALMELARRVTAKHTVFSLKTAHLGGFPKDGSARILWLGFDEEPGLDALANDLRRELRAASVIFDDKPFKAHLTLARFKTPQAVARFADPPKPETFEVRDVTLFQSAQSRYLPLGHAPLGAG